MQRWDRSADRAQRVDEKVGLKCLKNGKNQVYFQSYVTKMSNLTLFVLSTVDANN